MEGRNLRKERIGLVLSNKMDKTITAIRTGLQEDAPRITVL